MKPELSDQLREFGYQGRVVSIQRLRELKQEIETRLSDGSLDKTFSDENLSGFDFGLPEKMPDARSLIVVAVKQPQVRFTFTWNDARIQFMVPPTYVRAPGTDIQIENTLNELLDPAGYRVTQARLPKKLLAVRSGLAEYGKNNITYVSGLGSFHRLAAFYSDLPCDEDVWQETKMMARCETCSACLNNCPTGAIPSDRFLLRAERCIVFHNEHPNEIPFPSWMDPSWHNCIVGCMLCQIPCPEDRVCLDWIEDSAEFSAEETQLLIEGRPIGEFPPEMTEKLNESDLVYLLELFPRNLKVLLEKPESS
jgi:epoxyqueuosine reductase